MILYCFFYSSDEKFVKSNSTNISMISRKKAFENAEIFNHLKKSVKPNLFISEKVVFMECVHVSRILHFKFHEKKIIVE